MSEADKLFEEATAHVIAAEHDEAVELYKKAIEEEADHIDSWIGMAGAYFSLKKYEDARNAARELLSHRPKFPDAWFVIGQSEVELKNLKEAAMAFGTALDQKEALKSRFKEFWEDLKEDHEFRKLDEAKGLAKKHLEEDKK